MKSYSSREMIKMLETDGWYKINPDLKCAASGTNDDDALLSARELPGCVLNGLEEGGEEIPA